MYPKINTAVQKSFSMSGLVSAVYSSLIRWFTPASPTNQCVIRNSTPKKNLHWSETRVLWHLVVILTSGTFLIIFKTQKSVLKALAGACAVAGFGYLQYFRMIEVKRNIKRRQDVFDYFWNEAAKNMDEVTEELRNSNHERSTAFSEIKRQLDAGQKVTLVFSDSSNQNNQVPNSESDDGVVIEEIFE